MSEEMNICMASEVNYPTFFCLDHYVSSSSVPECLPSQFVPDGRELLIKAKPGNQGNIYIGSSRGEASSKNFTLQPNESLSLLIEDANLVWVSVDVDGDGVEYSCEDILEDE